MATYPATIAARSRPAQAAAEPGAGRAEGQINELREPNAAGDSSLTGLTDSESSAITRPTEALGGAAAVCSSSRGTAGGAPALAVHFPWLTRARRVLLAMAAVWVLNVFDLGFTLVESAHGHFVELNPIAASFLGHADHLLVAYKFGLLTFGTTILLLLRHHRMSELGCWMLLAAYVYVGVRWYAYYQCLLNGGRNSFVEVMAVLS